MGQTSDLETSVIHQKMTPGNNPEDVKQHYNGGSLQLVIQLHIINYLEGIGNSRGLFVATIRLLPALIKENHENLHQDAW
jgi:hypothetical protein